MIKALRITAHCLASCGLLAEGLSTDPPTTSRPRKAEWTRWEEIDEVAAEHSGELDKSRTEGRHPTVVSGDPVVSG